MPETTSDAISAPAGQHIAVLAFPFGGHAAPLLSVVRRLAAAAPGACFSFFSTAQANASTFSSSSSCSNVRPYDVADGVPEGYTFKGHQEERIELFTEVAPAEFREAISAAEVEVGRAVSCVVGDALLWFAADIAEEMGVPWVAFWAAAPAGLVSHFYSDAIRHKFGAGVGTPGHEDKSLEFIPGMSKIRIRDLPRGIVAGNRESVFPRWLHQMGLTLPRATAIFMNTFEELDPPIVSHLKSQFKNVLAVGPSNFPQASGPPSPDPNGCIPWLDKHEPASVVYVSFGSVLLPPPPELKALAEALEASELPFLMSLRDHARAHLPEGFPPAKGKVVSWAPQTEVLTHWAVGALVTHCGWNSMLESIAGAVPMICRPLLADNPLNGRMVESAWGIGVGVEGGVITKTGLMKSMDLVLSQEQGQHMKTSIRKIKELAETAIGPNGSSDKNLSTLLEIIIMMQKNTA